MALKNLRSRLRIGPSRTGELSRVRIVRKGRKLPGAVSTGEGTKSLSSSEYASTTRKNEPIQRRASSIAQPKKVAKKTKSYRKSNCVGTGYPQPLIYGSNYFSAPYRVKVITTCQSIKVRIKNC